MLGLVMLDGANLKKQKNISSDNNSRVRRYRFHNTGIEFSNIGGGPKATNTK